MTDMSPAGPEEQLAKDVETLPGRGGPDDSGAVDVAEEELNVPRDTGAH